MLTLEQRTRTVARVPVGRAGCRGQQQQWKRIRPCSSRQQQERDDGVVTVDEEHGWLEGDAEKECAIVDAEGKMLKTTQVGWRAAGGFSELLVPGC